MNKRPAHWHDGPFYQVRSYAVVLQQLSGLQHAVGNEHLSLLGLVVNLPPNQLLQHYRFQDGGPISHEGVNASLLNCRREPVAR